MKLYDETSLSERLFFLGANRKDQPKLTFVYSLRSAGAYLISRQISI